MASSGCRAADALFQATITGNLDMLKSLADLMKEEFFTAISSERDSKGLTVLHCAALHGKTRILRFLVEDGKLDVNMKDCDAGDTPLHYAVREENFPMVAYLLENGANPNATENKGRTPLHHAVEKGSKRLIETLLAKGADINAMAIDCGTPLQYASGTGQKKLVKVLLDHKANPNLISNDQFCPLLSCVLTSSIDCLKLLLEAGADPNICPSKGMTPLGCAAVEGDTEAIKCLLRAGADPNIPDAHGFTPVEEAALNGNHEDFSILFPVTSPIPGVREWSPLGLFQHVYSSETEEAWIQMAKERFLLAKSKGAEAFKQKDYLGAMQWYTEAYSFDPTDAAVVSNRSLCLLHMNQPKFALQAAEECIQLRPDWSKAYYRAGSAYMKLKDYKRAADAFSRGLELDPKNKEIELALREATDAQQKRT